MTLYRSLEDFRPGDPTQESPRPGGTSAATSFPRGGGLTRSAVGASRHHLRREAGGARPAAGGVPPGEGQPAAGYSSAAPRALAGVSASSRGDTGVPRTRGRVYTSRARRRGETVAVVLGTLAVLALPAAALLRPFWSPLATMALLGVALIGAGVLLGVACLPDRFRFVAPADGRRGAR